MNTVCAWKWLTFIPNSPILDVVLGFAYTFQKTFISMGHLFLFLTFSKSAAVINHKFQRYANTSQNSEAGPQRCSVNMQRIYRRTSMYMCGFHKFEQQVWVFSCKFTAYLRDTILPFCQKTSGGLFLNILFIEFAYLPFNQVN